MSRQKTKLHPAFIITISISLLLIVGLIKNAIGLYQSRNRLELVKISVAELEAKKNALATNLQLQTDPVSTDQIIRNKLNLALPGDTVIAITGTESTSLSIPAPLSTPQLPIYLQWWRLFNP